MTLTLLFASVVIAFLIFILLYFLYIQNDGQRKTLFLQLLGTFCTLGIAFAANNAFVYGIAIFIVATLVTDLEFLEKLAAIVFKNESYFKDYRAELVKLSATQKEVTADIKEQAKEEKIPPAKVAEYVKKEVDFKDSVYDLLVNESKGIFSPLFFIRNPKFTLPGDQDVVSDGLVETDSGFYILEFMRSVTKKTASFLNDLQVVADASFSQFQKKNPARVLLVTTDPKLKTQVVNTRVAILRLKKDLSDLQDREKILKWMAH